MGDCSFTPVLHDIITFKVYSASPEHLPLGPVLAQQILPTSQPYDHDDFYTVAQVSSETSRSTCECRGWNQEHVQGSRWQSSRRQSGISSYHPAAPELGHCSNPTARLGEDLGEQLRVAVDVHYQQISCLSYLRCSNHVYRTRHKLTCIGTCSVSGASMIRPTIRPTDIVPTKTMSRAERIPKARFRKGVYVMYSNRPRSFKAPRSRSCKEAEVGLSTTFSTCW